MSASISCSTTTKWAIARIHGDLSITCRTEQLQAPCAGASGGRRRLQQAAALSPTAAATQLAAVQGPIFGVLSAAGAAMVVGEMPAVISGGTVRAPWPAFPRVSTLSDVAIVAGETPAVISGGTVRSMAGVC